MNIDITKTDGSLISSLVFKPGVIETIRVSNAGATGKWAFLFLIGADDKDSDTSPFSNQEGKELIADAWGLARLAGGTDWTQIGVPEFPDDFTSLGTNAFSLYLPGSGLAEVEIKIIPPSTPETAGVTNFNLKVMA